MKLSLFDLGYFDEFAVNVKLRVQFKHYLKKFHFFLKKDNEPFHQSI